MEIQNLAISSVKPSPLNPRKTFGEADLQELADNIRQQGLLQPITVRPMEYDDQVDTDTGEITSYPISYEVVCGERRYRACVLNGSETISAIVREMNDDEAFDAMVTENLQRKDVDPIEEAYAFRQLVCKGSTAEDVALRFGKSVRFVQDRIKLNSLIPELHGWVRDGRLPLVSAMIVAKLSEDNQSKFAKASAYQAVVTKETTLNYVNNLFSYLCNTPWAKDNPPFTGGCGVACADCPHNSSNAGCLFYEMKSEPGNAKCTDRKKIEEKALAYLKKKLTEAGPQLVKKGSAIEKGRVALVDEGTRYNSAELHERALGVADGLGYEIFTPGQLGSRCWYRDDDGRTKAMLESGEVIKGLSIGVSVSGPSMLTPCFFYTRSGGETSEETAAQEAVRLAGQYAEVGPKIMESAAKSLLKQLEEGAADKRPLTNCELAALAVAVLLDSGSGAAAEAGLRDPTAKEAYRHVADHPDEWGRLLRRWTYAKLGEFIDQAWRHGDSAVEAVLSMSEETLPEEHRSAMDKAEAAIDKKRAKLAQQLSDLGYGTDGKLLEYKEASEHDND